MSPSLEKHLPAKRDDEHEDNEVSQNAHPRLSQAEANMLTMFAASMKSDAAPPSPPKASWASAPVIIGMAVGILSIAGSALTQIQGYTQIGDRVSSFGERILAHDGRISFLEKDFQVRGQSRDRDIAVLTAANGLQDERLQNITKALEQERQARVDGEMDQRRAIADQRNVSNELAKTVGEMRSDLKVLVDRAQRHSEADGTERDALASGARTNPH